MSAASANDVVIVGAKRTAIGSFLGQFTGVPTPTLGATAIRPFVLYGGTALYGREEPALPPPGIGTKLEFVGYALNFGAGIDFILHRHLGLSAGYQYLYVDLRKEISAASRLSGPKVTFKLLYLF